MFLVRTHVTTARTVSDIPVQTAKPVAVAGGLGFYQVSAGGFHTCGKTGASVAYCWGTNFNGELGNGSTTESRTPVGVAGWTP